MRPKFYEPRWRFRVDGEVERELDLSWAGFSALPREERTSDFHCVTTWSKLDVEWSGVLFLDIAALVQPKDSARFVIAEGSDYYTTNLPLEDCMDEDVLLADRLEGEPLPRDHGGPLRLVVPKLYAWKSAKFLNRLTFSSVDQPGYWAQRGYHRRGDPWNEERHSYRRLRRPLTQEPLSQDGLSRLPLRRIAVSVASSNIPLPHEQSIKPRLVPERAEQRLV